MMRPAFERYLADPFVGPAEKGSGGVPRIAAWRCQGAR